MRRIGHWALGNHGIGLSNEEERQGNQEKAEGGHDGR